jgi:uncharacterized YccA/Bax inhibitor family protein
MANDDKEMFKRSGNPTLKPEVFERAEAAGGSGVMTVEGTVNKTGLLFILLAASAAWTGWQFLYMHNDAVLGMAIPAIVVGLILGLVISFVPKTAPYLAPVYALCEGAMLGVLSGVFELKYPGIVVQAAGLTLLTLAGMLLAYKTGMIKATEGFKRGMMAAMFAILAMILIQFVASFFTQSVTNMLSSGPIGLVIAVAITGVAALSLVLDFDMIEQGARRGAPKYMEWYGAFALMVTLVWLYIRILDLLSRLRKK